MREPKLFAIAYLSEGLPVVPVVQETLYTRTACELAVRYLSFHPRRSSTRRIGGNLPAISAQLHAAPPTGAFLARVYKVQHALIALAHALAIRICK